MKLMSIAGGLFAIAGVFSAPESADAAPAASGSAMAAKANPVGPTASARHLRYQNPRIQCVRAPCYVPRPHRPWHIRHHLRPYWFVPHYRHARVVCRIRYGHHGPRQVCHFVPV